MHASNRYPKTSILTHPEHHFPYRPVFSFLLIIILAGCNGAPAVGLSRPEAQPSGLTAAPSEAPPTSTLTPFQPLPPTPEPSPTSPPPLSVWISPAVPPAIQEQFKFPADLPLRSSPEEATLQLSAASGASSEPAPIAAGTWIYTLVAPFPSFTDEVSFNDLRSVWQGKPTDSYDGVTVFVDPATREAITTLLGEPGSGAVESVPAGQILDQAWERQTAWAVVPFETLEPRWKVIRVDGQSPLDKGFVSEEYPLSVLYGITGLPEPMEMLRARLADEQAEGRLVPVSNRDPSHLTVVVVTGVTALVRATAWQMVTKGVTFPARDVGEILQNGDITHISNEVAFAPNCPPPDPNSASLRFCSNPDHLELLKYIGADVIELSGNHVNDWGAENLAYSLDLYREAGMKYYSGGANREESRQPALFEHNGNRLAFIGCNPAGPSYAWATDTQAGSADCADDWLPAEVSRLRDEGYLPIVTLQFNESYDPVPLPAQQKYFKDLANAGAIIVSGSQAHYPQGMGFEGDSLIHYGLGNLFFDQMYYNGLGPGTRWEFIDRHVIYNGKHISTELITAMLEEFARPRLMTAEERQALLELIFKASGWLK